MLPTGVLVRSTGPPTTPPQFRTPPIQTLLLPNAAGPGQSALQPGQTFSVAGVFAVTVETQVDGQSGLRFRWADTTAPAAPRIVSPRAKLARRARFDVRWTEAAESGSGVTAYDVSLDGGQALRVPVQFPLTPYASFAGPCREPARTAWPSARSTGPATAGRLPCAASPSPPPTKPPRSTCRYGLAAGRDRWGRIEPTGARRLPGPPG